MLPLPLLLLLLLLLGGLTGSQPALADRDPIIAQGATAGRGWAAITFETDGSKTEAELLGYFGKLHPYMFWANLYDKSGASKGGVGVSGGGFLSSGYRVYADANAGGYNVHQEVDGSFDSNSYGGFVATAGPGAAGTYTWLVIASSPTLHWKWSLRAGPGVSVLAVEQSDRALYAVDADFHGPVAVVVHAELVGGHAVAAGEQAFTVGRTWIGGLLARPLQYTGLMNVSTPSGEKTCSCFFLDLTGSNRMGVGAYTARLTGASPDDVILWGADAAIPARRTLLHFTGGSAGAGGVGQTVPVEARLIDAGGLPIAGAEITFRMAAASTTVTTDASGLARASITLPGPAGYPLLAADFAGIEGGPETASASMVVKVT